MQMNLTGPGAGTPRRGTRNDDVRALPEPYRAFWEQASHFVPPTRLFCDPFRTLTCGVDASFYKLTPKIVAKVQSRDEVVKLLEVAGRLGVPVTFRAAGTSLSGQAVTDSVLVVVAGGFTRYQVHERGERITLEAGVIGGQANALLAPYGRKIGPDPASIHTCMIGGIVANNASGMCCGTDENSYRTVESMRLLLWDGTLLDTADPEAPRRLAGTHPELWAGLTALHDEVAADTGLAERIRTKFRIKNTTGYSLNAFVDFHEPLDILLHLMVGSEGTLAFIVDVTYRTVPELPHKASALVAFPDIEAAARATMRLKGGPVSAVELMDRASLSAVAGKPGLPAWLRTVGPEACALLVETRGLDAAALAQQMAAASALINEVPTLFPVEFTAKKAEFERLWDVRRGLFPAVGSVRRVGTTVIIEDVAFPMEHLAAGTVELQRLMRRHGYEEGIIFGHALDGNLHFVFTQDFASPTEVARYARFMDEVCEMVAHKYDGSLKGEHGTGRNVAPFVEFEWGQKAYALMRRLKRLFDPRGILNPGVIITDDPRSHLKNLKPLPQAHPVVDRCIECGFCEPKCPSRNLTTTPRQRIVVQREMAWLRARGDDEVRLKRLEDDYRYMGDETCATDGLCATACPVSIDTGVMTKQLRAAQRQEGDRDWAREIASHFAAYMGIARRGLGAMRLSHSVLGDRVLSGVTRRMRSLARGWLPVPTWSPAMPGPARKSAFTDVVKGRGRQVVYFPSCIARTMGPAAIDTDRRSVFEAMLSLLDKADYDVLFPRKTHGLCCGLSFESKGFPEVAADMAQALGRELLERSDGGRLPVLCDTSPCLYFMKKALDPRLTLYEPAEFIQRFLLDKLRFERQPGPVALHVTCSSTKMGLGETLRAVMEACADQVVIPQGVGCCGFAGDKGFTHPELNASAVASLKSHLPADCTGGYSNARTCEIGLSQHSGISYQSIAHLVDRCTRRLEAPPAQHG